MDLEKKTKIICYTWNMNVFKKFWYVWVGILFASLYFFLRLTSIMTLPLFTDESIYVRWSQIALNDASWRYISLTDGKQPLFVWIAMTVMRFVHDPILAGRLSSVGAGFLSALGLFFLTKEVFKKNSIAVIASLLYILYPFALVLDRMALYDSLVATFVPWSIWLELLLVKKLKSYMPWVIGFVVGFGVLNKSNAFFNLALFPVTLLSFDFTQKHVKQQLLKWVGYAALSSAIALFFYNSLRLSQYFYIINLKNQTFVYPLNQWIHHPFAQFVGNFHGLSEWAFVYTGIVMTAILVLGLVVENKFWKEKAILVIWFAAPFIYLSFFGRTIYARWELAMVISLIPIMALAIDWIGMKVKNIWLYGLVFLVLVAQWGYADYKIITDFAHAPIPESDLNQYINDWPAGGGAREINAYFGELSKHKKIYVATEGTFGSVPTIMLELYQNGNPNLEKRGIWPTPATMPQDLIDKAKVMPVFYVLNQTQTPPPAWHVELIAKYQKGIGTNYLHVYRVLP